MPDTGDSKSQPNHPEKATPKDKQAEDIRN